MLVLRIRPRGIRAIKSCIGRCIEADCIEGYQADNSVLFPSAFHLLQLKMGLGCKPCVVPGLGQPAPSVQKHVYCTGQHVVRVLVTYSHVLKHHHDRLRLQACPIELHNVAIKAQTAQELHLL